MQDNEADNTPLFYSSRRAESEEIIMANNNFNFGVAETTSSAKVAGKTMTVWRRSYSRVNKEGKQEIKEVTVTEPGLVSSMSRVDALLSMKEFSLLGLCYELSEIAKNKEKLGFRSIAEIGENLFHLKASTATQYARVGKHFIIRNEDAQKGVSYRICSELEELNPSVTNLVQCLSLVDEKSDEPAKALYEAISDGKLNIGGTLQNLKKEIKALTQGDSENDITVTDAKEISSEKVQENKPDFTLIYKAIDNLSDDKKAKAVELVTALQELLS